METLGNKLRNLRKAKNLTQQQLAEGLVTASMVSQVEGDRAMPSPILLEELAKRLGVDMDYFANSLVEKADEMANYRTARQFINEGQYREAVNLLESLSWPLGAAFKPEVIYHEMAKCYTRLKEFDQATKMYECLIQLGYERNDLAIVVHGYYNAGTTLRRLGQTRVSTLYFARAREVLLQNQDLYMPIALKIDLHLARIYLLDGRFEDARDIYEETLRLHQTYGGTDLARAHHGLSCAYLYLKDFELALFHCHRAIEEYLQTNDDRGVIRCKVNVGVILRYAGRLDEAKANLLTILDEVAGMDVFHRTAVLHELTLIEHDSGNYSTSLTYANEALQYDRLTATVQASLRLTRANSLIAMREFAHVDEELRILRTLQSELPDGLIREANEIERRYLLACEREDDLIHLCTELAKKALASARRVSQHGGRA